MFAFQSFVCQGFAPGVIRLLLNGISKFKEYSIQFEKEDDVESGGSLRSGGRTIM